MAEMSIAVIGGGFAGSLLAIHLLRKSLSGTRVHLFDRSGRFGSGLAYGTEHAGHLLNAPAAGMSAFQDRPRDFLNWLARRSGPVLAGVVPAESAFVPRHLYGAYLRDLLLEALCGAPPDTLVLRHEEVVALDDDGARIALHLKSGDSLSMDAAVIAGGNFPAVPVLPGDAAFRRSRRWRPDPWASDALRGLDPTAPVLLVGTWADDGGLHGLIAGAGTCRSDSCLVASWAVAACTHRRPRRGPATVAWPSRHAT